MINNKHHWLDSVFILALAMACVYWLILYVLTQPTINWLWPLDRPRHFLYPAIVFPILEEIIFRGFIQDWIKQKLPGAATSVISKANLITSLIFSALHFINQPPVWAAAVFIPSLIFGYFKDRTGNIGAPIALHIFYNSGYFLIFANG